MTPHERAAEFVASYFKLTEDNLDITNFQRVLEMKVSTMMLIYSLKTTHKLFTGTKEE